jgi:GNAT superfamily N-acetyltransferase
MRTFITSYLSLPQKDTIRELWNREYPQQLSFTDGRTLEDYLLDLRDPFHFLVEDEGQQIIAWAFLFEREKETWFSMIVKSNWQGRSIGRSLIQLLKERSTVLNGWVIDHNNYKKQNGEIYISPLPFYLKNKFDICPDTRLETDLLSAVKIQWKNENRNERIP